MRDVNVALVAYCLAMGLAFIFALGFPWRSENPPMTWLQSSLAFVAVLVDGGLLLSAFGIHLTDVIIFVILLTQAAVFTWRITYIIKIRVEERRADRRPEDP